MKFPMLSPGYEINGKYSIQGMIGSGGMGVVYAAEQIAVKRRVAIKVLYRVDMELGSSVSRFRLEAQAAGFIGHDNVCEVTDMGISENGLPYLVMPFLEGFSLKELLTHRPPFTRFMDIFNQTLSALHAAHEAGFVHRDLKPSNIFITTVGDRTDFVKLLDFGVSKVVRRDLNHELTSTGMVVGTPQYMAPEQARGKKKIDRRVDVYAASVILYESLTGAKPITGDSYNQLIFNILNAPFPTPRSLDASIPAELERIVLKAMDRNPAHRFSSAEEMRHALQQINRNRVEGVICRTVSTAQESNSMATEFTDQKVSIDKRRPKVLLVAVLLCLGIVIVATGIYHLFNQNIAGMPISKSSGSKVIAPVEFSSEQAPVQVKETVSSVGERTTVPWESSQLKPDREQPKNQGEGKKALPSRPAALRDRKKNGRPKANPHLKKRRKNKGSSLPKHRNKGFIVGKSRTAIVSDYD